MSRTAGGERPAGNSVQSIDRAVAILRCFSARTPVLGISEIARSTGLSTSTAHRLLAAMQSNRLIRHTADRRYALGPLLVQVARSGALPATLREAALPEMHALRDATDETVGLHELVSPTERAVIEQVESHQPLRRTYTEIGVPLPLPYGAQGKVLLAFLSPAEREAVLARPLEALAPGSIQDPDVLRAQLPEIRASHWALSLSERTPGIHTVAAPLFDHTQSAIGCLSLSGPTVRLPEDRLTELAPLVRAAAWAISEALGATDAGVRACAEAAASEQPTLS
ncbi:IclR family transcriptional regulator [Tamaricihabitans halophyticus]|uniref:Glycerol operon regulatory protein n=1 Tax=Tamaricihabitans halophyticus TaxID=1262583 RepID=A0A4R2QSK4_9PSEU|nr:IclR family transcriptional regulator [Tamaricihabitans halophyticus]TCP50031.1 IclR family transcriptional regulator [Tamaricihabitans halophyticus]